MSPTSTLSPFRFWVDWVGFCIHQLGYSHLDQSQKNSNFFAIGPIRDTRVANFDLPLGVTHFPPLSCRWSDGFREFCNFPSFIPIGCPTLGHFSVSAIDSWGLDFGWVFLNRYCLLLVDGEISLVTLEAYRAPDSFQVRIACFVNLARSPSTPPIEPCRLRPLFDLLCLMFDFPSWKSPNSTFKGHFRNPEPFN